MPKLSKHQTRWTNVSGCISNRHFINLRSNGRSFELRRNQYFTHSACRSDYFEQISYGNQTAQKNAVPFALYAWVNRIGRISGLFLLFEKFERG